TLSSFAKIKPLADLRGYRNQSCHWLSGRIQNPGSNGNKNRDETIGWLRKAFTLSQSGREAKFKVSVLRQRQAPGLPGSPPFTASGGFLFCSSTDLMSQGQETAKKISGQPKFGLAADG
ncbi:MAG: hypothetical protein ACM335_08370, partial [Deltaproteobacteria bacterium]